MSCLNKSLKLECSNIDELNQIMFFINIVESKSWLFIKVKFISAKVLTMDCDEGNICLP